MWGLVLLAVGVLSPSDPYQAQLVSTKIHRQKMNQMNWGTIELWGTEENWKSSVKIITKKN